MNNGNPNENDKGVKPPRVPLLEDVITPGKPAGKNGRKHHALAPDPDPRAAGEVSAHKAPPAEPAKKASPAEPAKEASPAEPAKEASPAEPAKEAPPAEPAKDEDPQPAEDVTPPEGRSKGLNEAVKLDPYIREWLLENAKSLSGKDTRGLDRETVLRAGANLMVENLVKEYSKEIVERLRKELTSLLEELDIDKEKSGDS